MPKVEFASNFMILWKYRDMVKYDFQQMIDQKIASMQQEVLDAYVQKFGFDVGYKMLVEKTFRVIDGSKFCHYQVSIRQCEDE